MGLFVAIVLIGGSVAGAMLLMRRSHHLRPIPLLRVEFWVYATTTEPPTEAAVLERLVSKSPFQNSAIGSREAMTLSDVRFRLSVLRRAGNEIMFHPEMHTDADTVLPPDLSATLEKCSMLVKLLFISEEPLRTVSHLQFCTYVAEAVAHLTDAALIFDVEAQKFYGRDELAQELHANPDAARYELNVRVVEQESPDSLTYFTRGMSKLGLPDLYMDGLPTDHRTLGAHVVDSAAQAAWTSLSMRSVEFDSFGDSFIVEFNKPRRSSLHRGMVADVLAGRKVPLGRT